MLMHEGLFWKGCTTLVGKLLPTLLTKLKLLIKCKMYKKHKVSMVLRLQAGEPPSHTESLISQKGRTFIPSEGFITNRNEPTALRRPLDLGLEDEDEEGDSFFDDPLPKPQKTYGW